MAHIQSKIQKDKDKLISGGSNQMLNGAMSQAMAQAGGQTAQLNQ